MIEKILAGHSKPEWLVIHAGIANKISITGGDIVNIATCDEQGNPNVTPIGSMRIVNGNTVHVMQSLLPRTYANLKKNPKATFVCIRKFKFFYMFKFLLGKGKEPLGYRIYCSFIGSDDSKERLRQEYTRILNRFPFFLRKLAVAFCEKTLHRLLLFKITDIRAISD